MEEQKEQFGDHFSSFIFFKKFVSVFLIQWIYLLGALMISLWGVYLFFQGLLALVDNGNHPFMRGAEGSVVSGLLIFVAGNLVWRVMCEASIVIFHIHDTLCSIKDEQTRRQ